MRKLRRTGRRSFLLGSAALLGTAAFSRGASAEGWPARPVRIIVSFPPGGLTDLYARAYGEDILRHIGQPVLVEKPAGAGGPIGCDAGAQSPPDGYTPALPLSAPLLHAPAPFKKLPY